MKKIFAVLMAVMLMIFTVVPAFAAHVISPDVTGEYDIIINNSVGGTGSYTSEIIEGKKYITLTADTKDGFVFTHWEIDGEYEIVEGSLKDEEIVIILKGDCEATPNYEGVKEQPTQNNGDKSPQTGDSSSYVFLFVGLFVALAGATGLKIAKSKK